MFDTFVHVLMLYVGDATQLLLFVVGLASLIEWLAHRSTSRLLIEVTPKQTAAALGAQLAILLVALLGFKFVVLSGGPGIAVHSILRTGALTRDFSAVSLILAAALSVVGMVRLFRILRRKIILVRR